MFQPAVSHMTSYSYGDTSQHSPSGNNASPLRSGGEAPAAETSQTLGTNGKLWSVIGL